MTQVYSWNQGERGRSGMDQGRERDLVQGGGAGGLRQQGEGLRGSVAGWMGWRVSGASSSPRRGWHGWVR